MPNSAHHAICPPVRTMVFAALFALSSAGVGGCDTQAAGMPGGTGGTSTGGGSSGGTGTGGGSSGGAGTGGGSSGGTGGVISTNRTCGAADLREAFSVQLEDPTGTPLPGIASFATYDKDIAGSVTSVKSAGNAVRIEITEAGHAWTLAVNAASASEAVLATATALVNTEVKLHVRRKRVFQPLDSWGVVLRNSSDELLMAIDAGPFVQTLGSGDIAPLTLTNGPDICDADLCIGNLWSYTQLQVSAADGASVVVDLGSNAELTSGSRRYTVRNVGVGHFTGGRGCADVEHSSTWAIWSRASAQ